MTKHSCDESCQCCARCYRASGHEVCDQLCKHSTPRTTLREQIEQLPRYRVLPSGGWIVDPKGPMVVLADVLHVLTERPAETEHWCGCRTCEMHKIQVMGTETDRNIRRLADLPTGTDIGILPLDPPLYVDGEPAYNAAALFSFIGNAVRLRGSVTVTAAPAKEDK